MIKQSTKKKQKLDEFTTELFVNTMIKAKICDDENAHKCRYKRGKQIHMKSYLYFELITTANDN